MTSPNSRKQVVTRDDLDTLNRNSAYARTQGEAAQTAATEANKYLTGLGDIIKTAAEKATGGTQAKISAQLDTLAESQARLDVALSQEGLRAISLADGIVSPAGVPVVAGYMDREGQSPQYIDQDAITHMHGAVIGGLRVTEGPPGSGIHFMISDQAERTPLYMDDQGTHIPNLVLPDRPTSRYTYLICRGDSMTQGFGSAFVENREDGMYFPGGGYPRVLQSELGGSVTVVNLGKASAKAYDIAAFNVGGAGVAAQYGVGAMQGGAYPLAGLNDRSPLLNPGTIQTQRGRLGEVRGTLRRDNTPSDWQSNRTTYYTFIPDAGQPTLETAANPVQARRKYTWHPDTYKLDMPTIIWAGRNNRDDIAQTVTSVKAMLTALDPKTPRIVIGVLAGTNESWGNGREEIEEVNRQLAELAGSAFLDPNEILGRNADGSIRADGTPRPAFMADNLHCNDTGYTELVTHALGIRARIMRERWFEAA